jgi:hypothetical protein
VRTIRSSQRECGDSAHGRPALFQFVVAVLANCEKLPRARRSLRAQVLKRAQISLLKTNPGRRAPSSVRSKPRTHARKRRQRQPGVSPPCPFASPSPCAKVQPITLRRSFTAPAARRGLRLRGQVPRKCVHPRANGRSRAVLDLCGSTVSRLMMQPSLPPVFARRFRRGARLYDGRGARRSRRRWTLPKPGTPPPGSARLFVAAGMRTPPANFYRSPLAR